MIRRLPAIAGLVAAVLVPVIVALWAAPPPAPRPGTEALPDFTAIAAPAERRDRFIAYLEPVVAEVNAELRDRRARLHTIEERHAAGRLLQRDLRWLVHSARRYRVDTNDVDDVVELLERLEPRVDIVPAGLAIAQAGIESGWGQSRFAREGNNLFGEWCFEEGCGLIPQARHPSAQHEVRTFATVHAAVRSYMHNLNSHRAYATLRRLRAEARAAGREPQALELAAGLYPYSQRGQDYVDDVRAVIRANDLD